MTNELLLTDRGRGSELGNHCWKSDSNFKVFGALKKGILYLCEIYNLDTL